MNKIEISNSKISLINWIDAPPNHPSNNMLAISDLGTNIHLSKQATNTMAPVIISTETTERLPDGITMYSSHIATLQLPGLRNQAMHIHVFPKMKTAPLISVWFLCDNGCAITLENQEISVHKNGQEIIKGRRNKKTGMWEVPLENQQVESVTNNNMKKTSKTELVQHLHTALFGPTAASPINSIKQGLLKMWPGLSEKLIKRHLEKSRNMTMVHLYMRRQGIQ